MKTNKLSFAQISEVLNLREKPSNPTPSKKETLKYTVWRPMNKPVEKQNKTSLSLSTLLYAVISVFYMEVTH